MQREGDYPSPSGCPEWMGIEIAGTITKVGKVAEEKSNWKVGEVKPTIHAVLPISEAEAAHDILYKSQNIGKVVLTVE